MQIYKNFKEFLEKTGRFIIHHAKRKTKQWECEYRKENGKELKSLREKVKAENLKVRVTRQKAGGFKATLRDNQNMAFVGFGPTEFAAISNGLDVANSMALVDKMDMPF